MLQSIHRLRLASHLLSGRRPQTARLEAFCLHRASTMVVDGRRAAGRSSAQDASAAASEAAFAKLPIPNEPNHAVYGSLLRPGLLDRFDVYGNVVYFDCLIGPRPTGHDGIVHGGVISLLFDEACGWAYDGLTYGWDHFLSGGVASDKPGVTANLSVNFKRPLKAGVECIMRVHLERVEGRKLFFRSTLEDVTGDVESADATCVYVSLRSRL